MWRCTAISRRLPTKKYNPTIPKGIVHGTYISCFSLALANIRPWPLVQFFEIPLKNSEHKATHNHSGLSRSLFPKKKTAWILFDEVIWGALKPFDIPHCLQAQVPSKMQRADEGSDYTRKRRSLSDTRTGKYECYACNLRSWRDISCATTSFRGRFC